MNEHERWLGLVGEVRKRRSPRPVSEQVIRRLARRYGEREEYVRLLFQGTIQERRLRELHMSPSEERFVIEFEEAGLRYLAWHLRRPQWVIQAWLGRGYKEASSRGAKRHEVATSRVM